MNRREFLQAGFFASAAAALSGCRSFVGAPKKGIALQLWSINKIMWKDDPAMTLATIKAMGFDGVEFAGFGDRSAKEIRQLLRDAGLRGMGAHMCEKANFTGDGLKKNLDFCAEAGIESLSNAWADFDTKDGWVDFGVWMGEAAETAAAWGIPISVHNHCHEFTKKYDGTCAWDLIFTKASPRLMQQLDTSQVANPGLDCVERYCRYPGRSFSIHVKENVPSADGYFGVPPDDGGKLVPWNGLIACTEADADLKWYVVECERRPDSFMPAIHNIRFLKEKIASC